jgi:hypothetical protein
MASVLFIIYPVISTPIPARGRPSPVVAMQPWRTPTKRRAVPQFSRKPGRKPTKHLMNSVMSETAALRRHLATRKGLGQLPGKVALGYAVPFDHTPDESLAKTSIEPLANDVEPSSLPREPNGVSDDLDAEDLAIWSADCSRWDSPAYWLRIEEMMVFVDMLNSFSSMCGFDTWFCVSPGSSSSYARALSDSTVCFQHSCGCMCVLEYSSSRNPPLLITS